jgi:hypothetical protein
MKRKIIFRLSMFLGLFAILNGCIKEGFIPVQNEYLKKIKVGEYIVAVYTYNEDNLILEVNSTSFYRKFTYDDSNKLIKEEVAISPDSYSSSMPAGMTHEFVDPDKTGISMYSLFEYNDKGNLSRQLNYIPSKGQDELRSIRTFEYDSKDRISKVLLHDGNEVVTQFSTFLYDSHGNVTEENSYSYLFIPEGTGPTHLSKATFEYDSYLNPYSVFRQTGRPGIDSNPNNIIKIKSYNLEPVPGVKDFNESETSYEYNYKTGCPVRVINGEEFIYNE